MKVNLISLAHDLTELGILVLAILTRDTIVNSSSLLRYAGVLLAVLGIAFAVWSMLHLRRQVNSSELVTTGPYRFIRHPYYLGWLVGILGLSTALLSLWGIIATLIVLLPVTVIHSREEDKELAQEFGETWGRYAERISSIFPGL